MLKNGVGDQKVEWAASAVTQTLNRSVVIKRAELESEALNLPADLPSDPHLWLSALGSDRKNKIANTSGQN